MKDFFKKIIKKDTQPEPKDHRKDLERKTVKGAEKALKEYHRVFERLAEFDKV